MGLVGGREQDRAASVTTLLLLPIPEASVTLSESFLNILLQGGCDLQRPMEPLLKSERGQQSPCDAQATSLGLWSVPSCV